MARQQTKAELLVSIVVFKEDAHYVAQGLEYDICVQADTIPRLLARFERTALASYFVCVEEGKDFQASFPPAPREFWDMFEKARQSGPPMAGVSHDSSRDASLVIPQIRYIEGLAA